MKKDRAEISTLWHLYAVLNRTEPAYRPRPVTGSCENHDFDKSWSTIEASGIVWFRGCCHCNHVEKYPGPDCAA